MKEENTGKNRKKGITPQVNPEGLQVREGPAYKYHELSAEELRNMIDNSCRFFRIAADLSITPN